MKKKKIIYRCPTCGKPLAKTAKLYSCVNMKCPDYGMLWSSDELKIFQRIKKKKSLRGETRIPLGLILKLSS